MMFTCPECGDAPPLSVDRSVGRRTPQRTTEHAPRRDTVARRRRGRRQVPGRQSVGRAPHFTAVAGVLALVAMATGCRTPDSSASAEGPSSPLPREIALARDYLLAQQEADGRFIYRRHLTDPGRYVGSRKYNLLRHAGTIYALSQLHELGADPELARAITAGAAYLRRFIADGPAGCSCRAIWTDYTRLASLRHRLRRPVVKLGGQGLGLVALTAAARLDDDAVARAELRAVGRCLLWMQRDNGSFRSKYIGGLGFSRWVSLYYPGEAALGLIRLGGLTGEARWTAAARDALVHLAETRKDAAETPADHWALIATAELLDAGGAAGRKPALMRHARRIIERMLSQQITDPQSPIRGAFRADGTTTPTAIRLEGMLAMVPHLGDSALRARVRRAAKLGAAFLRRAQIVHGPHAGAIPRATIRLPENPRHNARAAEVRIDYVQHALSAFIAWHRTFGDLRPTTSASAGRESPR